MSRWRAPATKTRTPQERLASMLILLGNSTDAAIGRLTVDDLVRLHGVSRKDAEYHLIVMRQKRGLAPA